MFNTQTFHGVDGVLTVADAVDTPPESGSPIADYFGDVNGVVGRVVGVTAAVRVDVHPFHEIGRRTPLELRAGNMYVTGSVKRAYVNGALLRMLLGRYADAEEANAFAMPRFDMILSMDNLAAGGGPGASRLTLYSVLFDGWSFTMPEDDFVLEKMTFQARRVAIADTEVEA